MVSAKVVENALFKRLRRPCLIVIARRFSAEAIQIHNKAMLFDWIASFRSL